MKDKIKTLIVLWVAAISQPAYSKPEIVTSITPIASLASMLTRDAANVTALDPAGGCPHDKQAKPADKRAIENAQMVVYIDDDFDAFTHLLLRNYQGTKVKISDFSSIKFHGMDGKINWHFWLDLRNVRELQNNLARVIIQSFPELQNEVRQNLDESAAMFDELEKVKQSELGSIKGVALLSDSLEHFFSSLKWTSAKTFYTSNSSLKNLQKLEDALRANSIKCLVIASDQKPEAYKKYNLPVVQLDSENWPLPDKKDELTGLFINKYIQMIKKLQSCR